ncbi:MAG: serine/threonine-protein kinase [Myxococcota bacterium]
MGRVYRAFDRRRGHDVALKLVLPRHLDRPERELRFLQERSLGRRSAGHPNLVSYLDHGRLRDRAWPFVTMVLVPGESLVRRLVQGPLPPAEALSLARQIATAVRALHREKIAHRDVTPMNVLVHDGTAVLIDLSHASELHTPGRRKHRLTLKHERPGTRLFMSPEQARAEPAQTAMDVYGFGVLFHYMLAGGFPQRRTRRARLRDPKRQQPPPPPIDPRTAPGVPWAAARLVRDCVALAPERRPTIDEVIRRLDEQLEEHVATNPRPRTSAIPTASQRRWCPLTAMALLVVLAIVMR